MESRGTSDWRLFYPTQRSKNPPECAFTFPSETEGPFAPKPSLLSGHELAPRELSQEASGL